MKEWCNANQAGYNLEDLIFVFLVSSSQTPNLLTTSNLYSQLPQQLETVILVAFALVDLEGWAFEVFCKVQ